LDPLWDQKCRAKRSQNLVVNDHFERSNALLPGPQAQ
jgi:hypothetical protein